ncbi:twin-arginine translocation signal domain-containing protein [Oceanibium sediminis]|uniref:twin-arginine translocation signal domain-containing protein n=1 Tax=Oceanibium sediminis TaxID=2026339 RepID=UPI000DD478F3|nr:twin-arginine translocation signal domain-containing protein [Oceanibium sediminis]
MSRRRLPRPSRRQFLAGTAAVGVAATGGAAWMLTDDPKDFIVAMIRRSVPYVEFEPGAIEEFAASYYDKVQVQRRGNIEKISKMARGIGMPLTETVLDGNEKYENFRRTTVSTFLIGTDFFDETRDTTKPVAYFGINPCGRNPFAEFA